MIFLNILVCLVLVYVFYIFVQSRKFRKVLNKIPAMPEQWVIGHMGLLLRTPKSEEIFDLLRKCANDHWPIYRFSAPYVVSINILHPGDFEIILSQMKHLTKSKIYNFMEAWLGKGLLTSTGVKWQTRRKILTRAFHFNILKDFLQVFNGETQNMVRQIQSINEKNRKPKCFNVMPIVTHMTLQSISETAMGIGNIDSETVKIYRNSIYRMGKLLLNRITSPLIRSPLIYPFTPQGKEERATIHTLHDFTYRVIREREKQILNMDFEELISTSYSGRKIMKMLDLLLFAKMNEDIIDYEGIREEVDTFMFEGHDTTAAAISFLLYSLAKYPSVQEEVRREIFEVLGSNSEPSFKDLQQLCYTERVIKETLRLYPSVPFISRVASEDFVTHTGYHIPKGTMLHLHIFDLHRNPRIYPDPLKFDPDRFLPENLNKRHPFAYLPFSAGPRNCIGQKFAILEIKTAMCGVLRNFRLVEDETTDLNFIPDLVLRVNNEIRIKFLPI